MQRQEREVLQQTNNRITPYSWIVIARVRRRGRVRHPKLSLISQPIHQLHPHQPCHPSVSLICPKWQATILTPVRHHLHLAPPTKKMPQTPRRRRMPPMASTATRQRIHTNLLSHMPSKPRWRIWPSGHIWGYIHPPSTLCDALRTLA